MSASSCKANNISLYHIAIMAPVTFGGTNNKYCRFVGVECLYMFVPVVWSNEPGALLTLLQITIKMIV